MPCFKAGFSSVDRTSEIMGALALLYGGFSLLHHDSGRYLISVAFGICLLPFASFPEVYGSFFEGDVEVSAALVAAVEQCCV